MPEFNETVKKIPLILKNISAALDRQQGKRKKPYVGDGFNSKMKGEDNIDEGMWRAINIDEELGHTLGFPQSRRILSPSKIMTLGEGLDKINKDTNVLAYRGENILGFALYPEFQIGDEEKILRYFVEKL